MPGTTEPTRKPSRPETRFAPVVSMPDTSSPEVAAKFAAELRSLSNYEVWERVETAILAPRSAGEKGQTDTWRFRLLLDELQWRYSGIEGAGKVPDLDKAIAEAQEVH